MTDQIHRTAPTVTSIAELARPLAPTELVDSSLYSRSDRLRGMYLAELQRASDMEMFALAIRPLLRDAEVRAKADQDIAELTTEVHDFQHVTASAVLFDCNTIIRRVMNTFDEYMFDHHNGLLTDQVTAAQSFGLVVVHLAQGRATAESELQLPA